MKRTLLIAALGLASASAFAQDFVVPVLSSSPVVQQVAVPRQVCGQGMVAGPNSGGGALLGGLLGAGLGSQIGGGSGRGAGLAVGAVAGALLGNSVESSQRQAQAQCATETMYENRTVAYNVTYEYAGRQYSTQLPYQPGPTIRLQGSPVGASGEPLQPQVVQAPQAVMQQAPMVVAPQQSMVTYPAVVYSGYPEPYPVYAPVYRPSYYQPYYPPVGISLNFGYSGGWHHRHYR